MFYDREIIKINKIMEKAIERSMILFDALEDKKAKKAYLHGMSTAGALIEMGINHEIFMDEICKNEEIQDLYVEMHNDFDEFLKNK